MRKLFNSKKFLVGLIAAILVLIVTATVVVRSQNRLRDYALNDAQHQWMVKNDAEVKEAQQKFDVTIYNRQRTAFAYAQSLGIPEDQMDRFELKLVGDRYHLTEMDEATYQKIKAERAAANAEQK